MRCLALLALIAILLTPIQQMTASAQDSMPPAPYAYTQLEDPALEAEALKLMATLRCLKCQSQSIHDSDAPMAGDMRHLVRTRLLAGDSPEQVRAFLIERYGVFVSYEPKVSATTWPLFAIPLALILVAGIIIYRRLNGSPLHEGDAA